MSVLVVVRNDERAEALLRWAAGFSIGNADKLYVLDCREGRERKEVHWRNVSEKILDGVAYADALVEIDAMDGLELVFASAGADGAYQTVFSQVSELSSDLLLLDRNLAQDSNLEVEYIKRLLEDVPCAVMVVRLGETDGVNSQVLIPCGGGPHSRHALRVVDKASSVAATAFFVESDVDEVSLDVGYRRLQKIISRSGVDAEEVTQRAVIAEDVVVAVANEVKQGDYGMVLVGASDVGSLRKKLFGTLSDKFFQERDGTAIGVIRAERPLGHKLRDSFENFISLRVPQLQRDERVSLFADIEDKSRWSFDFAVLMVLATSIASLGLLADSGAVVIGAMLVAPLMTPLLGGGLSLVQGHWPLWKNCQKAVLLGFFSALSIGVLCGVGAKFCGMHLTGELAARGNPTALDLGVAFVSGIAASYCLARPKLSGALAGVAIAAALVPPIATTGICIALGEMQVVRGAALLFGTNVVAIVFGAALNFYVAGIRGRSGSSGLWSRRLFIIFALLCVGLAVPLTSSLLGSISDRKSSLTAINEQMDKNVRIVELKREGVELGMKKLLVLVETSQPLTTKQQNHVLSSLKAAYGDKIIVRLETVIVSELK